MNHRRLFYTLGIALCVIATVFAWVKLADRRPNPPPAIQGDSSDANTRHEVAHDPAPSSMIARDGSLLARVRKNLKSVPIDRLLNPERQAALRRQCKELANRRSGDFAATFREILQFDQSVPEKERILRSSQIFWAFQEDPAIQADLIAALPPHEQRSALLGTFVGSVGEVAGLNAAENLYDDLGAGKDRTYLAAVITVSRFHQLGLESAKTWIASLDFPEECRDSIVRLAEYVVSTANGNDLDAARNAIVDWAKMQDSYTEESVEFIFKQAARDPKQ